VAVLSWEQIAAVARLAGWPADQAITITAITMPESSRNAAAVQQGVPYAQQGWGLTQITPGNSEPAFGIDNQLLDPLNNLRAARAKYLTQGGFRPWTTFMNGLEQPWLADAAAGVKAAYGLSAKQLAAAVAAARTATAAAPAGTPQAADWSAWVSHTATVTGSTAHRTEQTARAVKALAGRFTPPKPTVPAPGKVLAHVERLTSG
jgi:lysozyme-like protein